MEILKAWWFHLQTTGENTWYFYVICGLLLYGVYQYLFDNLVTKRRCAMPRSVAAHAGVAASTFAIALPTGLILVWRMVSGGHVVDPMLALFLGLLQGTLFLLLNITRVKARTCFAQHTVLSVTKANVLIVILVSWLLFHEDWFAPNRLAGFLLIGLSIYLFWRAEGTRQRLGSTDLSPSSANHDPNRPTALSFLLLATVVSASIALLAKYAVGPRKLDVVTFMFFSNAFSCFVAFFLFIQNRWSISRDSKTPKLAAVRPVFIRGALIGILNLFAYAALLQALSMADASVVIPMYSLYLIVPVLLATVFDGVRMSELTSMAILLSLLAMAILR